jgi:hypothetical protein
MRRWRARAKGTITAPSSAIIELDHIDGAKGEVVLPMGDAVRAVVVTESVPMPFPFASGYEFGLTEQVVACAGTVQETVTDPENPKNGFTPISLM